MASKKASGFVSEEQRHTDRLTLRLDPGAMAYLEEVAGKMGCTKATAVLLALEALEATRQASGEVMSSGIRTALGMRLMNRAGLAAPFTRKDGGT
jgi:hypothetical protein